MRFSLRVFGLEVLAVDASTDAEAEDEEYDGSGVTSATPISFVASTGDVRWEPGAGGGEL